MPLLLRLTLPSVTVLVAVVAMEALVLVTFASPVSSPSLVPQSLPDRSPLLALLNSEDPLRLLALSLSLELAGVAANAVVPTYTKCQNY